jgi:uncharacterized protein (DUF433 family)
LKHDESGMIILDEHLNNETLEGSIYMNKRYATQKAEPAGSALSRRRNGHKVVIRSKGKRKLVREMFGGEPYEYYRIGRYIVSAPGICGGRPTFKFTRIDVRHALALLTAGRSVEEVAAAYRVPIKAIHEALILASKALDQQNKEYAKAA